MKGKTLVIHKNNDEQIPRGIYTIKGIASTGGGYGHGPHDYYPPYKTFTIIDKNGDSFVFRDRNYVKLYLPSDCYKILNK